MSRKKTQPKKNVIAEYASPNECGYTFSLLRIFSFPLRLCPYTAGMKTLQIEKSCTSSSNFRASLFVCTYAFSFFVNTCKVVRLKNFETFYQQKLF